MSDMSMVERVARAIYPFIVQGTDYDCVPFAEAMERARYADLRQLVLAAARGAIWKMRKPSDAMLIAGLIAGLNREAAWVAGDCGDDDSGPLVSIQAVYEAMIEAALNE